MWSGKGTSACIVTSSGSRSLAFDGKYVYVTSSSLRYLLKLGSGKRGTIRGLLYASEEVGPGWVVFVDGVLLHRKPNPEGGTFCRIIDRDTLKVSVRYGAGIVQHQLVAIQGTSIMTV